MADLSQIWPPVLLTLQLAGLTTLILVLLGTPIAWWLVHSQWKWKEGVAAIVALPLVLPPTVLGFYLLLVLGPTGPGGWLAVMTCFQTEDRRFAGWHYRKDLTHVVFYRESTQRWIAALHGWECDVPVKDVALMHKTGFPKPPQTRS